MDFSHPRRFAACAGVRCRRQVNHVVTAWSVQRRTPRSIRLQCREIRRPTHGVHDETRFRLVLRWNGFSNAGLFERKWTGRARPLQAAAKAPAQTRAAAAPPPALSSARCRLMQPLQTVSYQKCRVGSEWESAIIQARVTKQQPHAMPRTCCARSSRPSAALSASDAGACKIMSADTSGLVVS